MTLRFSLPTVMSILLMCSSCSSQETPNEYAEAPSEERAPFVAKKAEPHRYGGWYCPDNFGFVPVDIQRLAEVPAIADRLPTQQELDDHMSLINVDLDKYPDAKALEMDLPRVARIYSSRKGMHELIVVIQAVVVQEDTVVGYRFANGGNGSAWLSEVSFLSNDEVAEMGPQPFFYSHVALKASPADIWNAIGKTAYFNDLGEKFNQQEFFSAGWEPSAEVHLNLDVEGQKVKGYVGMVYGNYYLHIDYIRDGFHYSEKMLMAQNGEDNTTELFFASGPYPDDFEKQQSLLDSWMKEITANVQAD